jgi:hypothetical protein
MMAMWWWWWRWRCGVTQRTQTARQRERESNKEQQSAAGTYLEYNTHAHGMDAVHALTDCVDEACSTDHPSHRMRISTQRPKERKPPATVRCDHGVGVGNGGGGGGGGDGDEV